MEKAASDEEDLTDEIEYASDDVDEVKAKPKAKPAEHKQKKLGDYHDVEEDDNVFIDNLPNTTHGIHALLSKTETHAEVLEKGFIEEEDSETEEIRLGELMA